MAFGVKTGEKRDYCWCWVWRSPLRQNFLLNAFSQMEHWNGLESLWTNRWCVWWDQPFFPKWLRACWALVRFNASVNQLVLIELRCRWKAFVALLTPVDFSSSSTTIQLLFTWCTARATANHWFGVLHIISSRQLLSFRHFPSNGKNKFGFHRWRRGERLTTKQALLSEHTFSAHSPPQAPGQ